MKPWLLVLLCACRRGPDVPISEDAAAGLVNATLFDDESCVRPELCVRDPAFVDPIIQSILDQHYQGRMPTTEREAHDLADDAKSAYGRALQTKDGLRRTEELAAERFAHPVVTTEEGTVTADFGLLPGGLGVYRGRYVFYCHDGPHCEGFGTWKSTEIAAAFQRLLAEHPRAERVTLLVDVPQRYGGSTWTYTYERAQGVVVVAPPQGVGANDSTWVSEPLGEDFGPYLRGEKTFETANLTRRY